MTEPGDVELTAHYDEAGNVVRITVDRADPVIRVAVELLAQMDPNPLTTDGLLTLDTAGEYRLVRLETPDTAIFERDA